MTRRKTCFNAVEYYSNDFDSNKIFYTYLSYLENNLACLKVFFLTVAITYLEKSALSLDEGFKIILTVKDKLYKRDERVAESVKTKMDSVPKNNKGFKTLFEVRSITNDEYEKVEKYVDITLNPGLIASFKYPPLTSCVMEMSFSEYKTILRLNAGCSRLKIFK